MAQTNIRMDATDRVYSTQPVVRVGNILGEKGTGQDNN